ncbi:MAG: hypothetical protein CVT75_01640 [Alphaproteobacteria bacterium HGW-Alphaproteobacteria-14]|nr:MAG: hypothetical protein CVT75_01640 [Alphaproteobacteria bacterium HGW-Alphaproteobacteria-14]
MLLAAFALAAAQPVAEPATEPTPDTEITVIANRLRDWHGRWRLRKGAVACKTTRSTGDKAIDAIGCDALVTCIAPLAPRFAEIEATKAAKEELSRRTNSLMTEAGVNDCLLAKRKAGIAALAAARRSKRS